ncbi:MAG: hypothetical protein LBH78_04520 [Rickettsiales bacterium]|nr:hypothetical protein [Rickettsiales bacterium]
MTRKGGAGMTEEGATWMTRIRRHWDPGKLKSQCSCSCASSIGMTRKDTRMTEV